MKRILFFIILYFVYNFSQDPNGISLVDGDLSTEGVIAKYGQRGQPDENSKPGGRQAYCMISRQNSIWIFGGYGQDDQYRKTRLDDIFEYSLITKMYTFWGRNEDEKNQVIENANFNFYNQPGEWSNLACFYDEQEDFLYVFGGVNRVEGIPYGQNNYTNSMWVYTFTSNQWKQLHAPAPLNPGTIGEFGETTRPPNLYSWTNFCTKMDRSAYCFGGKSGVFNVTTDKSGWINNNHGTTQDLWEFNFDKKQWRLLHGNLELDGKASLVTEKGIFSKNNIPHARRSNCGWSVKEESGEHAFYMFGGVWFNVNGSYGLEDIEYYHDLWKFNISNGWALINGEIGGSYVPHASKLDGEYHADHLPATASGYASYQLEDKYFIITGGHAFNYKVEQQLDFSATWIYSLELNQWKFQHGYLGTHITTNLEKGILGSRDNAAAVVPTGRNDVAYIFGGECINSSSVVQYCNDLWEINLFDCFSIYKTEENACGAQVCVGADTCVDGEYDGTGIIIAMIVFGVLGVIAFLVILAFIFVFFIYRINTQQKKLNKFKDIGGDILIQEFDAEKASSSSNQAKIKINQELFKINHSDLTLLKSLGNGASTSQLFLGKWKGLEVAVKSFRSYSQHFEEFEKEVSIISSISHPFLVNFYGCSIVHPHISIVMEYCVNGDLVQYIGQNKGKLQLNEKIRFLREISYGMEYLHSKGIIHRDLKGENCLLDKNLRIKICDFGVSKLQISSGNTKSNHTKRIGTNRYMAPEVTLSSEYDSKCDVFSFAIILYEVLTEDFSPYSWHTKGNFNLNVEMLVARDECFRPRMSDESKFPNWIIQLMNQAWKKEPKLRPSFQDIVEMFENNSADSKIDEQLTEGRKISKRIKSTSLPSPEKLGLTTIDQI